MTDVWTGPYRESYMDMPTNISVERRSLSHINHRSWPAPSPHRLASILNLCKVHSFRVYTYEGESFGFLIGQWRVTWLVTIEMFKSLMHYCSWIKFCCSGLHIMVGTDSASIILHEYVTDTSLILMQCVTYISPISHTERNSELPIKPWRFILCTLIFR